MCPCVIKGRPLSCCFLDFECGFFFLRLLLYFVLLEKRKSFKHPKMRLSPDPNFLLSYKGYCLFEQRGMGALSSCLHDRNEGTEGGGERAFTIKEQGLGLSQTDKPWMERGHWIFLFFPCNKTLYLSSVNHQ